MRRPKPYKRSQNDTWYVQLDNKQVNLGKDETNAWEQYHRLMARRGEGVREGSYSVRAIVDAYWNWLLKNLAESTADRRKPILMSFGKAVPANLKARDLRAYHVQRWIDGNPRIKSPTTANTRITLIKGMMNWAEALGYIDKNPIAKIPKPAARIRQDFLPPDTWARVLELATDETFREFLIFMLSCGCRAQEVRILEARHFDENKFVLPIDESKGRKKSRVIYLPAEALVIVRRLLAEYPEGPLFRNSKGKPWGRNAIRCRFRRFKTKLKMPGLCATTLRHSYTHHRLTSGQDALTVSKLLGHADTQMISKRYGHVEANAVYMAAAANQIGFPGLPGIVPSPPAVT